MSSSSSYSLNPKKLKVVLTSLREAISSLPPSSDNDAASPPPATTTAASSADSTTTTTTTTTTAFCLLLVSELASRGTGITTLPSSNVSSKDNVEWIIFLLEAIRSVAGKVPIDDTENASGGGGGGGYPVPMMAALNAASGMAASACASSLPSNINDCNNGNGGEYGEISLLPMANKTVKEALEETLQRCLEVNDARFYTLLKLASDAYSESQTNVDSQSAEKRAEKRQQQIIQLKHHFTTIAYANYLFGASEFAMDQVPMWKRCLDAALENTPYINNINSTTSNNASSAAKIESTTNYQLYQNSQTILPLQNMIRIATSKNNVKRAKELSLLLGVGYLGGVMERLERLKRDCTAGGSDATSVEEKGKEQQKPKLDKLSMQQLLTMHYLHRTSSLLELQEYSTCQSLLECAKQALKKCDSPERIDGEHTLDGDNFEKSLLYHYLGVQIEHLTEESEIWIEVAREHRAMLNRRPEGGGSGGGGISSLGKGGVSIGSKKLGTKSIGAKKAGAATATTTTTSAVVLTKKEMESKTRSKVYLEAWNSLNSDNSDSMTAMVSLRDAIIQLSALPPGNYTSTDIVGDCYKALLHQVQRLAEIAMIVQQGQTKKKNKGRIYKDALRCWGVLLSFVSPLVLDHLHPLLASSSSILSDDGGNKSNNATLRRLVECCCEAVVSASWMCEPFAAIASSNSDSNGKDGSDKVYNLDNLSNLLATSHSCLMKCQHQRTTEEQQLAEEKKKQSSVLSSKDEYSDLEKKEQILFQCALATSKCRMDLVNAVGSKDENNNLEQTLDALAAAARRATIAATAASSLTSAATAKSAAAGLDITNINAKFGTPYPQLLSSWMGMYGTSWPFCSLGQARTIVGKAREVVSVADRVWGRVSSAAAVGKDDDLPTSSTLSESMEQIILDVAEADLEGTLMGGFKNESERLYRRAMDALNYQEGNKSATSSLPLSSQVHVRNAMGMLKVHCLIGLSRLSLSNNDSLVLEDAQKYAREALDIVSSLEESSSSIVQEEDSESKSSSSGSPPRPVLLCIYPWSIPSLNELSRLYHFCASRQLVAEACIRSGRPEDARRFLTDAVKDFPGNFEAAFALAAFHLRTMLNNSINTQNNGGGGDAEAKKTRILLLKAAKMDTTKPDPFALLGVWYESQNDAPRAKGCYQKALGIDPSHPVAGRGLLRLTGEDKKKLLSMCEIAARRNSSVNGWAWRAIGKHKSMEEGDDAAAVVCFQQALRCRDVQSPESDGLGAFYANPIAAAALSDDDKRISHVEASETWAELASCYRQLGKYSAALRAYEAAYSVSEGHLSPDVVCAWAQVDLDLGLYEAAAEKCAEVLSMESNSIQVQRMAAYIEGEALLFLARNCVHEGKFGSCLKNLQKGIARMSALPIDENSAKSNYCEVKLLGDLYSFGNSLPSYVFAEAISPEQDGRHSDGMKSYSQEVQNQLSFLKKGEHAYTAALELGKEEDGKDDDEDKKYLVAAAATDLGTNLLSQARIIAMALGEGSGGSTNTSSSDLVMQSSQIMNLTTMSVNAYLSAVDSSPHEASAWCGLGCALIAVDPLLSQHAFCRALQIDASLADSWSNVGLLYANSSSSDSTKKSSEVLDCLTQVDDTPLMWIGRGFLLEKTSKAWQGSDLAREACLTKAADAYRAALQIMQHPAALLGLSLTCRRVDPRLKDEANELVYADLADHASRVESRVSLVIEQSINGRGNLGASYVGGLSQIEEGLSRIQICNRSESTGLLSDAQNDLKNARILSADELPSFQPEKSELTLCMMDLSASKTSNAEATHEFPEDLIKRATDKVSTITANQVFDEISSSRKSCSKLDYARNNVYLNPESGEAWLIFANQLAQELSYETNDTSMLLSAKNAATKAYELLHERVVHATLVTPKRQQELQEKSVNFSDKSVVSSLPPASVLSQSISLVSWLDEAEAVKNGDDIPFESGAMQESFMLDPLNPIAASSLGITN